jgi:hypothetical protein
VQEITRPENADTTNNFSEAKHQSWDFAGAKHLSISEGAIFDLGESLLLDSQI